jgi:hypothetical protein
MAVFLCLKTERSLDMLRCLIVISVGAFAVVTGSSSETCTSDSGAIERDDIEASSAIQSSMINRKLSQSIRVDEDTLPQLCTIENQGTCECMNLQGWPEGFATYTWEVNGRQRCLQTYTPPSSKKVPVLLEMQCYTKDRMLSKNNADDGKRFGLARFQLSTPDGAWNFKESMEPTFINDDVTPMRCSAEQNPEDIPYVAGVFNLIDSLANVYDVEKVYTSGFSQNGMFSGYIGFCFSHRIAGSWQGGSGMFINGESPVPPGREGTCDGCKYFPLYPCTRPKPHVTCLGTYLDDRLVMADFQELTQSAYEKGGHPVYMYKAQVDEGHDARMMLFVPTETKSGHSDPNNKMDWFVGCLGINEPCSTQCDSELTECVDNVDGEEYASCLSTLTEQGVCQEGCAPTKAMLDKSDASITWLSQNRFGKPAEQAIATAPNSKCEATCVDDLNVNCYTGTTPNTASPGSTSTASTPSATTTADPSPTSTETPHSATCNPGCAAAFERCKTHMESRGKDGTSMCRSLIERQPDKGLGKLCNGCDV